MTKKENNIVEADETLDKVEVYDWNTLRELPQIDLKKIRENTKTGSDIDGVVCYYDIDKKDYRPTRLHEYHSKAIPSKYSKMKVDVFITGRRKRYRKTTLKWFKKYGISCNLLVMFPPKIKKNKESFDQYKSEVINMLELKEYHEDDPRTVENLKKKCPNTKIIFVDDAKPDSNNQSDDDIITLDDDDISVKEPPSDLTIVSIPSEKIKPDPEQPRKNINEKNLEEFTKSIRINGVMQPIEVRKDKENPGFYLINFGHRRYLACCKLGFKNINCIINNTDKDVIARIRSFEENVQRDDLSSVEREETVYDLWKSGYFKTQSELADRVGYNKSRISQILSAHEIRSKKSLPAKLSTKTIVQSKALPDKVNDVLLNLVVDGEIPAGDVPNIVKQILDVKDEELQIKLIKSDMPKNIKDKIVDVANKAPDAGKKCIDNYERRQKKRREQDECISVEYIEIFTIDGVTPAKTLKEIIDIDEMKGPGLKDIKGSVDINEVSRVFTLLIKAEDFPIVDNVLKSFDDDRGNAVIKLCKFYNENHMND